MPDGVVWVSLAYAVNTGVDKITSSIRIVKAL